MLHYLGKVFIRFYFNIIPYLYTLANMAFMALLAADDGLHTTAYRNWAKSQINYALGDSGRSFVCGFGVNPPVQPHHRGA